MVTKLKTNNLLRESVLSIGFFNSGWMSYPFLLKKEVENGTCLGVVDFDKAEILIEDGLEDRIFIHVLAHECWHILVSSGGLRQPDEDVERELLTTNEFVTELITRNVKLFKTLNPELWTLLYETNYE